MNPDVFSSAKETKVKLKETQKSVEIKDFDLKETKELSPVGKPQAR